MEVDFKTYQKEVTLEVLRNDFCNTERLCERKGYTTITDKITSPLLINTLVYEKPGTKDYMVSFPKNVKLHLEDSNGDLWLAMWDHAFQCHRVRMKLPKPVSTNNKLEGFMISFGKDASTETKLKQGVIEEKKPVYNNSVGRFNKMVDPNSFRYVRPSFVHHNIPFDPKVGELRNDVVAAPPVECVCKGKGWVVKPELACEKCYGRGKP